MLALQPSLKEQFMREWFGPEPRELGDPARFYAESPDALLDFIRDADGKAPIFQSVNHYSAPNTVSTLDKLFFDFDSKSDIDKAWAEAWDFADRLRQFYEVGALLVFSGSKGFHLYAWLRRPVGRVLSQQHLKALYGELQRMILGNTAYETLDRAVLGDVKRLARVPYSTHQGSGQLCVPVDHARRPVLIMSGFTAVYREHGIPEKVVETAARHVTDAILDEERRRRLAERRPRRFSDDGTLRPCMAEIMKARSVHDPAHKLMGALVLELKFRLGWNKERIVAAFSHMLDYEPSETKRQVDSWWDKMPFRCPTIELLGGCLDNCPLKRRRSY